MPIRIQMLTVNLALQRSKVEQCYDITSLSRTFSSRIRSKFSQHESEWGKHV